MLGRPNNPPRGVRRLVHADQVGVQHPPLFCCFFKKKIFSGSGSGSGSFLCLSLVLLFPFFISIKMIIKH
jgi:hypothetical protein